MWCLRVGGLWVDEEENDEKGQDGGIEESERRRTEMDT